MTTVEETVKHWVESCTTELQIITVTDFVQDRLIIDEPTRKHLIAFIRNKHTQRDWTRSKAILRMKQERFPADDEQPTDIIIH